jgi:protein SCO1
MNYTQADVPFCACESFHPGKHIAERKQAVCITNNPGASMKHTLLAVLAIAALSATSHAARNDLAGETTTPEVRLYDVKGEVKAVDRATSDITIAHEAIPGFMPAMTMPFGVRDLRLLDGVAKGDRVTGQFAVTSTDSWLTTLTVTSRGPEDAATTATPHQSIMVEDSNGNLEAIVLLREGDLVPDLSFVDQSGTSGTLHGLRGKAVGVTFVYTRCPMPNFCPALSRNFSRVQAALKKLPLVYERTHLVSVSIDPEYDVPGVLKDYAKLQEADTKHWSFVNAGLQGTKDFSRRFELTYGGSGTSISHNMRTLIISPDGRLVKTYTGSAWNPDDFAAEMRKAAGEPAQ